MNIKIIMASLTLTACAGPVVSIANTSYSAVNTGAALATDKGVTDRVVSTIADADCDIWNVAKGLYYCEVRDPSRTYNRNGF